MADNLAVAAAAEAILTAQNANDDDPERREARHLATVALAAAEPHLAYAAGQAAGDVIKAYGARITALEQLAADMLASYHQGSDGYRGRVGQVQIARWRKTLAGDDG